MGAGLAHALKQVGGCALAVSRTRGLIPTRTRCPIPSIPDSHLATTIRLVPCQDVPREPPCSNAHEDAGCDNWAKGGECDKNPGFMKANCAKACGACPPALYEGQQATVLVRNSWEVHARPSCGNAPNP